MKKVKKILAALLALAMMAPMALAAETSQSSILVGQGTYASPANAAVWSIEFPTADKAAFTIDPTGLVKSSGRYGEEITAAIAAADTVLFPNYNAEGGLSGYSKTSAALAVVNKSTSDITVELNARLTDTQMAIKTAAIASTETDTAIAFKMVSGSSDTIDPVANGAFIPTVGLTQSVDVAAKGDNFTTQYVNGVYTKVIGVEAPTWNQACFRITGEASNSDAAKVNWEKAVDMKCPSLQLTWNVRNKGADAIEIKFDPALKTAATGPKMDTDYFMAADCKFAVPGQAVTVYVQPKPVARDATARFVVQEGPKQINTAVKNYDDGSISEKQDDILFFSNGTASDNNMMKYTFLVPGESGDKGFTLKFKDTTDNNKIKDGNEIVIKGAPVIAKRNVTVAYDSSDTALASSG